MGTQSKNKLRALSALTVLDLSSQLAAGNRHDRRAAAKRLRRHTKALRRGAVQPTSNGAFGEVWL